MVGRGKWPSVKLRSGNKHCTEFYVNYQTPLKKVFRDGNMSVSMERVGRDGSIQGFQTDCRTMPKNNGREPLLNGKAQYG
jgi:hypothetical protein